MDTHSRTGTPTHIITLHHPIIGEDAQLVSVYAELTKRDGGTFLIPGIGYIDSNNVKIADPVEPEAVPVSVRIAWNQNQND